MRPLSPELDGLRETAKYLRAELEKAADTDFARAFELEQRLKTVEGHIIRLKRARQRQKREKHEEAAA